MSESWRDSFGDGINSFRAARFEDALSHFNQVRDLIIYFEADLLDTFRQLNWQTTNMSYMIPELPPTRSWDVPKTHFVTQKESSTLYLTDGKATLVPRASFYCCVDMIPLYGWQSLP